MTKKTKRNTRKKSQSTKRKRLKKLTKLNLFLSIVTILIVVIGGYIIFSKVLDKPTSSTVDKDKQYNKYIEDKMSKYISDGSQHFEEYTEEIGKDFIHAKEKIEKLKEQKEQVLEDKLAKIKQDILESLKHEDESVQQVAKEIVTKIDKQIVPAVAKKTQTKEAVTHTKPRLAIIIDDVSYKRQVDDILNIGYPVNMSFLPPTPTHKNSALIAQTLDNYMIHLPLQAGSSRHEEKNTLQIGDSLETIEDRIKTIKILYPDAKYINNHTGSKFTADNNSMDKLMQVLKKYDLKFIDSRTTAKTVAKQYASKYGVPFYPRNIFLDNKQEYEYIQGQLKKAVKVSKKTGLGIAIGHPHSMTIKVLRDSKHLFNGVELIYVDQL